MHSPSMSWSDASSLSQGTFPNYKTESVSQMKIVHVYDVIKSSLVFLKCKESQLGKNNGPKTVSLLNSSHSQIKILKYFK